MSSIFCGSAGKGYLFSVLRRNTAGKPIRTGQTSDSLELSSQAAKARATIKAKLKLPKGVAKRLQDMGILKPNSKIASEAKSKAGLQQEAVIDQAASKSKKIRVPRGKTACAFYSSG